MTDQAKGKGMTGKPAESGGAGGEAAVVAGRGALFIGFAKGYFMISGFLSSAPAFACRSAWGRRWG